MSIQGTNLTIASFAMERINDVKILSDKNIEAKYKTLVKKMPTLIQKNGLIATLVFNLSKKKNREHKQVLRDIIEWVNKSEKISTIEKFKGFDKELKEEELINTIVNLNSTDYKMITKEVMNLFIWIKRLADGMIEGE